MKMNDEDDGIYFLILFQFYGFTCFVLDGINFLQLQHLYNAM